MPSRLSSFCVIHVCVGLVCLLRGAGLALGVECNAMQCNAMHCRKADTLTLTGRSTLCIDMTTGTAWTG